MSRAQTIVDQMVEGDAFSRWLGIEILEIWEGYARIRMVVREDMLNGHGIAHGGISFSLADTAFAYASNSHGRKALSIDASINHIKPISLGDRLEAVARKENISERLGHYIVRIHRRNEMVGVFKGVVFRKDEMWKW